jgi:hypothetical protein
VGVRSVILANLALSVLGGIVSFPKLIGCLWIMLKIGLDCQYFWG